MNFGGIHFFYGLFFVACCMALTIAYFYIIYLFFVSIGKGIYSIRHRNAQNRWFAGQGPPPDDILPPQKLSYFSWTAFRNISVMVIVILSSLYISQRTIYMGPDNRHYGAKEYWVAGQVVLFPRRVLFSQFHPENIIIRPYTYLQKKIFNLGIKQLPEKDGEGSVWQNSWFLYQYSKKSIRPIGVGSDEYEPDMVSLLDQCWSALDGMASLPIADPKMMERYLKNFVALASYYSTYQGHYTGKFRLSGEKQRQNPLLMERLSKMLNWLDRLPRLWVEKEMMEELKSKEYSIILALHQGLTLDILNELSLAVTIKGEFECSHPIIERLYQEYVEIMSDDPDSNYYLLYSQKNFRQAKIGYRSKVYGATGDMANYLLSTLCNKEMPKEKNILVGKKDGFAKFEFHKNLKRVFKEEFKQLEGGK